MGILDGLRQKVEQLGDKAREGLDVARDKAGDVVDDVRDRLGQREGEQAPTGESEDVGPDSSSTDAVQPGYVTGEDEGSGPDDGDSSLTDDADAEVDDEEDAEDSVVEQESFAASVPDGAAATETDLPDLVDTVDDPAGAEDAGAGDGAAGSATGEDDGGAPLEPVATDVDPYDQPLSESIGDELSDADRAALARAVGDDSSQQGA